MRTQSDLRAGDVVKAAEARYCAAPAGADAGAIELAVPPDDTRRGEGDIERAPEPAYCEQPVNAGQGDVTLRD